MMKDELSYTIIFTRLYTWCYTQCRRYRHNCTANLTPWCVGIVARVTIIIVDNSIRVLYSCGAGHIEEAWRVWTGGNVAEGSQSVETLLCGISKVNGCSDHLFWVLGTKENYMTRPDVEI